MQEEEVLVTARENPLGCGCITKATLTLGLYLLFWAAKKLIVTNKRVTWQTGVLSKSERTIPLNRVTDISVSRGFLGNLLGYGNIRVESAGASQTEIVAGGIQNPDKVREAILQHAG